jgi:hypothetical protein
MSLTATIGSAVDSIGATILLMPNYTSALDATTGQMYPGTTVAAKAFLLDYGVSGNGFYEVSAIDGIYGQNSPYSQIATWTGHPATGTVLRVRTGNLRGVFGVADEYGTYMGNGTGVANQYLRLSSYTNEIHNLPIKMYNGANLFFNADTTGLHYYADPTDSYASFGDQAALTFHRTDGTKILRLGGFSFGNVSHEGILQLSAGPSGPSGMHINTVAPAGNFASLEIQNTVGTSTSSWLFKRLADGTVGADFSGYLSLSGYGSWTTSGWAKDLILGGQGHTIFWPKGAGGTARGLGVSSNGIMYFTRSTADDGSAAPIYDMTIDTSGNVATIGAVSAGGNLYAGGNLSVVGNLGAWSTPTYGTNWGDYGGSYGGIRYRRLGDMVMLQGLALSTATPGSTIVTMPAGYIPSFNRVFTVYSSSGTIRLDVNGNGTITTPGTTFSGANQWVSMNGVIFSTTL